MDSSQFLTNLILDLWHHTCINIASGDVPPPIGQGKEKQVFHLLKEILERINPQLQVCEQVAFGRKVIDLICILGNTRIAIEGKYKIKTDGAVPDNRKAAFLDLLKLETYIDSGEYAGGLFLWMTNEPSYLIQASRDSAEFSTHNGRVYQPNTMLNARRYRGSKLPFTMALSGRYIFNWEDVIANGDWYSLVIKAGPR